MPTTVPELPVIEDQAAFNLARWEELCEDPFLAALDYRIETDAYGHIVMSPLPAPEHGEYQSRLVILLHTLLLEGSVITECPVSTSGGVKGVDVAWISSERRREQRGQRVFTVSPELCIEILSPSNSRAEIEEKTRLYFEAGAAEVWICGLEGNLRVYLRKAPAEPAASLLCPELPERVEIGRE